MIQKTTQTFLLMVMVCTLFVSQARAQDVDLTGDTWDVSGRDAFFTWDDTVLKFTSQITDGSDFNLTGYFDWVGSNGGFGKEVFEGILFSDGSLTLTGLRLEPHPVLGGPSGIGITTYAAQVANDGNSIINGTWAGSATTRGTWEAVRVPEPTTLGMLVMGGFMLLRRRVA